MTIAYASSCIRASNVGSRVPLSSSKSKSSILPLAFITPWEASSSPGCLLITWLWRRCLFFFFLQPGIAKTFASSFSRSLKNDASVRLCYLNRLLRVGRKFRHREVAGSRMWWKYFKIIIKAHRQGSTIYTKFLSSLFKFGFSCDFNSSSAFSIAVLFAMILQIEVWLCGGCRCSSTRSRVKVSGGRDVPHSEGIRKHDCPFRGLRN